MPSAKEYLLSIRAKIGPDVLITGPRTVNYEKL